MWPCLRHTKLVKLEVGGPFSNPHDECAYESTTRIRSSFSKVLTPVMLQCKIDGYDQIQNKPTLNSSVQPCR